MILHVSQRMSALLVDSSLASIIGILPKVPDDYDENEDADEDDGQEEDEPAFIREPDELQ